jgi:hypothetical protein
MGGGGAATGGGSRGRVWALCIKKKLCVFITVGKNIDAGWRRKK